MASILNNTYDGWLSDTKEEGMITLMQQGKISTNGGLETNKSASYTEIASFISEEGCGYTDLEVSTCPCGGKKKTANNEENSGN